MKDIEQHAIYKIAEHFVDEENIVSVGHGMLDREMVITIAFSKENATLRKEVNAFMDAYFKHLKYTIRVLTTHE